MRAITMSRSTTRPQNTGSSVYSVIRLSSGDRRPAAESPRQQGGPVPPRKRGDRITARTSGRQATPLVRSRLLPHRPSQLTPRSPRPEPGRRLAEPPSALDADQLLQLGDDLDEV